MTKPANEDELIARVNVGARVVQLQTALAERVRSLEEALANVKALQTLLPMCAYCKSIRNDQNYWEKVETYFTQHSGVSFTHSYCPNCYERFVRPELEALEDAARRAGSPAARGDDRARVLDPAVIEQPAPADAARRAGRAGRSAAAVSRGGAAAASTGCETAWRAGNIEELHRAAHSLKGSAGNIGAQRLYERLPQLDETGQGRRPQRRAPLDRLRSTRNIARVEAEIQPPSRN